MTKRMICHRILLFLLFLYCGSAFADSRWQTRIVSLNEATTVIPEGITVTVRRDADTPSEAVRCRLVLHGEVAAKYGHWTCEVEDRIYRDESGKVPMAHRRPTLAIPLAFSRPTSNPEVLAAWFFYPADKIAHLKVTFAFAETPLGDPATWPARQKDWVQRMEKHNLNGPHETTIRMIIDFGAMPLSRVPFTPEPDITSATRAPLLLSTPAPAR